jgi:hypothetical protein
VTTQQPSVDLVGRLKRIGLVIQPCSLANAIMLPEKDTEPIRPPSTARKPTVSGMLGCPCRGRPRDAAGGAAAHAVVERDHLRHVGHRDPLAGPPGHAAADGDAEDDQQDVAQPDRPGQKKVTIVASTMPQPAQTMPPRAVFGELMRFRPTMNRTRRDEVAS